MFPSPPRGGLSETGPWSTEAPLSRDTFITQLTAVAMRLPRKARLSTAAHVCKLDLQLGLELAISLKLTGSDVRSVLRRGDVREFQQKGLDTLTYLIEDTLASEGTRYCSTRRSVKAFCKALTKESSPSDPLPEAIRPLLTAYFAPLLRDKKLEARGTRIDASPGVVTKALKLAAKVLPALEAKAPIGEESESPMAAEQARCTMPEDLMPIRASILTEIRKILSAPSNKSSQKGVPVHIQLPSPVASEKEVKIQDSTWPDQVVLQTSCWSMHVDLKSGRSFTVASPDRVAEVDQATVDTIPGVSQSPDGRIRFTSAHGQVDYDQNDGERIEGFRKARHGSRLIELNATSSRTFVTVGDEGKVTTAARFHLDGSSRRLSIKIGDFEEVQIENVGRLPTVETDGEYWAAKVGDEGTIFTFSRGKGRLISGLGDSSDILLLPRGLLFERSFELGSALIHDLLSGNSQKIHYSEYHEPGFVCRFQDGYVSSHWSFSKRNRIHLLFHPPTDEASKKVTGTPFVEELWRNEFNGVTPWVSKDGHTLAFARLTRLGRQMFIYDGSSATSTTLLGNRGWVDFVGEIQGNLYFYVRDADSISLYGALPEGTVRVDTLRGLDLKSTKVALSSSQSESKTVYVLRLEGAVNRSYTMDQDGFTALDDGHFIAAGHSIRFEAPEGGEITHLSALPAASTGPYSPGELKLLEELQEFLQSYDPSALSAQTVDRLSLINKTKKSLSPVHAHFLQKALMERPEAFVGLLPTDTHSFSLNRATSEALLTALIPGFGPLLRAKQRYDNRFEGSSVYPQSHNNFDGLGDDPDTNRSVILGSLDNSYDGFLAICEVGLIGDTSIVPCELPKTKQEKPSNDKISVSLDVASHGYVNSIALPLPVHSHPKITKALSERVAWTAGGLILNLSESASKKLRYSFRPEKTVTLLPPTQEQYDAFTSTLERPIREALSAGPLPLPASAQYYLQQIASLPPLTRAVLIRDWLAERGHYERDYAAFKELRSQMPLAEKIRFMSLRAAMLKRENSEIGQKEFSGVCADYALLALAMYRGSGILATVAKGYLVSGTEIDTKNAHALNVIYFPDANGSPRKLLLDATPSSGAHLSGSGGREDSLARLRQALDTSSSDATKKEPPSPAKVSFVQELEEGSRLEHLPALPAGPGCGLRKILLILESAPPFEQASPDVTLSWLKETYFPNPGEQLTVEPDDETVTTGISRIQKLRGWELSEATRVVYAAIEYARELDNHIRTRIDDEPTSSLLDLPEEEFLALLRVRPAREEG
jgi:hypothetical protein